MQTAFLIKNKVSRQVGRGKNMSLGAKLKKCRMQKGWPLQQVADAVGVSKAHIYELELNKVKNPSMETLKKLANLFEVPLSYFSDSDEDMKFQVMFRDLQEDFAALDPKDRETIELMVKALKGRKVNDKD